MAMKSGQEKATPPARKLGELFGYITAMAMRSLRRAVVLFALIVASLGYGGVEARKGSDHVALREQVSQLYGDGRFGRPGQGILPAVGPVGGRCCHCRPAGGEA